MSLPVNIADYRKPKHTEMEFVPIPKSVIPRWHWYRGGYTDVTKCHDCNMVGIRENCHPANPCHWCGGEVKDYGAGKWVTTRKKRTINTFWLIPEIAAGFWQVVNIKRRWDIE